MPDRNDADPVEPSVTVAELDAAIREVLGGRLSDALASGATGRNRMHEMACLKAFSADRRDRHVDVLREMWNALSRKGQYPDPEPTSVESDACSAPRSGR